MARGATAAGAAALALLALLWKASPSSAQAGVEADVEYAAPDGTPLLLDAYRPSGAGPHPAVLVIHGGRWMFGDKQDVSVVAAALADSGFAAFAVNYRLAPDHPFPAALEDLQAAVRWVREHAAEYDVDPAQVVALGGSAGGHLAALLATNSDDSSRVTAAVSWSGPMDLGLMLEGDLRFGTAVEYLLGCSDEPDCQERARTASPVHNLDAADSPLFLANGTEEAIELQHAELMAAELEEHGVRYELLTVPGDAHAFQYYRVALAPSVEFLTDALDDPQVIMPPSPGVVEAPPPRERVEGPREQAGEGRGGASGLVVVSLVLGVLGVAGALWWVASRGRGPGPPAGGKGAGDGAASMTREQGSKVPGATPPQRAVRGDADWHW